MVAVHGGAPVWHVQVVAEAGDGAVPLNLAGGRHEEVGTVVLHHGPGGVNEGETVGHGILGQAVLLGQVACRLVDNGAEVAHGSGVKVAGHGLQADGALGLRWKKETSAHAPKTLKLQQLLVSFLLCLQSNLLKGRVDSLVGDAGGVLLRHGRPPEGPGPVVEGGGAWGPGNDEGAAAAVLGADRGRQEGADEQEGSHRDAAIEGGSHQRGDKISINQIL